jgi:N-methylhydantoinase A
MKSGWLGVDTGGTFTDFVFFDGKTIKIHKVLSTPSVPEKAILQGVSELGLDCNGLQLIHGSTVATNAVLEGKGVSTVYITNKGFADVISIGRQARKELYALMPATKKNLIEASHCVEVDTRLSAQGELLTPLSEAELQRLRRKLLALSPRSVAINLLFSFLDDRQEKQIADCVPAGVFISRSADVLAEYKEYERGMATCLNAYIGPLMQGYLCRLDAAMAAGRVSVMQSSGGTIDAQQAGRYAVNLLLSGPAGGLKGAQYVAAQSGFDRLLTFDMGGTSTDVAMIDQHIALTTEGRIGDYPVAVPMVDMHTIGAGGGSIARLDAAGLLLVGPESAGADPGPACYARGGVQATVTDANLLLGRLQVQAFLGGDMSLDRQAASRAVAPLAQQLGVSIEQVAQGIVQIANEHMLKALRVMSVQRGYDAQEFCLVSFGGAGGLHVCALADALDMRTAMVPVHAGVLSALGMLVAAPCRQKSRTISRLLTQCDAAELTQQLQRLERRAVTEIKREVCVESSRQKLTVQYSVELRYQGQSFALSLPWAGISSMIVDFHRLHLKRYGHAMEMPVELVTIRVSVSAAAPPFVLPQWEVDSAAEAALINTVSVYGVAGEVNVYQRERLACGQSVQGPALILEETSTTFIDENWSGNIDHSGNIVLHKNKVNIHR